MRIISSIKCRLRGAVLLIFVALVCVAAACGPKEPNPVTPGEPLTVSLSGVAIGGGITPGGEAVSSVFTVEIPEGADAEFTLIITEITFAKAGGAAVTGAALSTVLQSWQFKAGNGAYSSLYEGAVIAQSAESQGYTLHIRVLETLDMSYAQFTLTFTVELIEKGE